MTEKNDKKYVEPTPNNNKNILKTFTAFLVLVVLIGAASIVYSKLSQDYANSSDTNINNITDSKITAADQTPITLPAIDFTFTDYDGNQGKLSDFYGKPIVLNFWASWCPPCKAEMPHFDKVYLELKDEVHFLMVNMTDGQRETVSLAKSYIESNGFSFPVVFDTKSEAARGYQIVSIPTTFFLNSDGEITEGYKGMIDENTLRRAIQRAG